MATATGDLWPEDVVDQAAAIRTPAGILREQASNLTRRTKGLVTAEVTPSAAMRMGGTHQRLLHEFVLVVPALNDYRYDLLKIQHDATFYPVQVISSVLKGPTKICQNEEEFLEALRTVFNSDQVKNVLQSLIAQARDYATR